MLTGDLQKARRLQAMFANISRDSAGATRAAMSATQESAAECFASESDPAGKRWEPLAASTLRGRKPGSILGGLADLLWELLAPGRWRVRSPKPYAAYHLGPDRTRPARAFLPVTAAQQNAVRRKVREALGAWLQAHRSAA